MKRFRIIALALLLGVASLGNIATSAETLVYSCPNGSMLNEASCVAQNKTCAAGTLMQGSVCVVSASTTSTPESPMQPKRIENLYFKRCLVATPKNHLFYLNSTPNGPCENGTIEENETVIPLTGVNTLYFTRCAYYLDGTGTNDHIYYLTSTPGQICEASNPIQEGVTTINLYSNPILYYTRCFYPENITHLFYLYPNEPATQCEVAPDGEPGQLEGIGQVQTANGYTCSSGWTDTGSGCIQVANCPSGWTSLNETSCTIPATLDCAQSVAASCNNLPAPKADPMPASPTSLTVTIRTGGSDE
jgi:hypothetical protein